jgi:hypothetical protein
MLFEGFRRSMPAKVCLQRAAAAFLVCYVTTVFTVECIDFTHFVLCGFSCKSVWSTFVRASLKNVGFHVLLNSKRLKTLTSWTILKFLTVLREIIYFFYCNVLCQKLIIN